MAVWATAASGRNGTHVAADGDRVRHDCACRHSTDVAQGVNTGVLLAALSQGAC